MVPLYNNEGGSKNSEDQEEAEAMKNASENQLLPRIGIESSIGEERSVVQFG